MLANDRQLTMATCCRVLRNKNYVVATKIGYLQHVGSSIAIYNFFFFLSFLLSFTSLERGKFLPLSNGGCFIAFRYTYWDNINCLDSFRLISFCSYNFHNLIHLPVEVIHMPMPISGTFTLPYNACPAHTIFFYRWSLQFHCLPVVVMFLDFFFCCVCYVTRSF